MDFVVRNISNSKDNMTEITSFSTYYPTSKQYEARCFNIALCSAEIDGTVIKNKEDFNWAKIVGNTNQKEGYKLADVYISGKKKKGYGGGVCQVASTIYNCALNLNMEIIERHKHGLPVSYVDYNGGKDAAVGDIGGPNLIFKNNLGFDILITVKNSKNKSSLRKSNCYFLQNLVKY